jgi:integrase
MASLYKTGGGWRVDWKCGDGRRGQLRLPGGTSERERNEFMRHLNRLIASRELGVAADVAVASYFAAVSDRIYDRLVENALLPRRERDREIAAWIEEHQGREAVRKMATDGTREVWARALRHARIHFGGRMLSTLDPTDGARFRDYLLGCEGRISDTMAEATVRKMCSVVSSAIKAARKLGLVTCDPFDDVPKFVGPNRAREVYLSVADAERLLSACDPELKVLVALARFAGLRVPSEIANLRWSDVSWQHPAELRVDSPKTKRSGKDSRRVPIAPRLQAVLLEAYSRSIEPDGFILPTLRTHTNPGMRLARAIKTAKIKPWPRPFHTLRASCETDWYEAEGLASAAAYAGNSPRMATAHYIRPTDASFRRAAGGGGPDGERPPEIAPPPAGGAGGMHGPASPRSNGTAERFPLDFAGFAVLPLALECSPLHDARAMCEWTILDRQNHAIPAENSVIPLSVEEQAEAAAAEAILTALLKLTRPHARQPLLSVLRTLLETNPSPTTAPTGTAAGVAISQR